MKGEPIPLLTEQCYEDEQSCNESGFTFPLVSFDVACVFELSCQITFPLIAGLPIMCAFRKKKSNHFLIVKVVKTPLM